MLTMHRLGYIGVLLLASHIDTSVLHNCTPHKVVTKMTASCIMAAAMEGPGTY